MALDDLDRRIVNTLQDGIPVCERPFASVARSLGLGEEQLLARVQALIDNGTLSRFGPMFDAARLGGSFSLCAMQVPEARFDQVTAQVNAFPEVAHNYRREHDWNMWFVLATESRTGIEESVAAIEQATGLPVMTLPKLEEFYVGLRLDA